MQKICCFHNRKRWNLVRTCTFLMLNNEFIGESLDCQTCSLLSWHERCAFILYSRIPDSNPPIRTRTSGSFEASHPTSDFPKDTFHPWPTKLRQNPPLNWSELSMWLHQSSWSTWLLCDPGKWTLSQITSPADICPETVTVWLLVTFSSPVISS